MKKSWQREVPLDNWVNTIHTESEIYLDSVTWITNNLILCDVLVLSDFSGCKLDF